MSPTPLEVARWRLHNQLLEGLGAAEPTAVVRHLLAVQAEHPSQSAWALGTRCADVTERHVGEALDSGRVVRTHALRYTWHYVAAEDAGWLLALTLPRVERGYRRQLDAAGLTPAGVDRCVELVAGAVADGELTPRRASRATGGGRQRGHSPRSDGDLRAGRGARPDRERAAPRG
ncbi:MAG: crosslink repair DNA glycosylase YcaQ family protein [Nocardioides sp.]